ncbi:MULTISPECIES: branched-chain amino acid ABC transporter permease [unclassified Acinetobacter]|uniref:branched-chain amino acid ABC transporter permease n=1 Tax=unclassified Acinetobacter TaxID=196816 RepID=UPI0029346A41|nr:MULTISPECIES: branched-chain amino acid ABC transporter permease [unclassified Acinetobacter]WOE32611.1 branched-chain amino acid ABC transporter permease [Acinetobacter sp. SAAs470]WOE38087.1 branched-chain amino acid ABC transporter permease [Acinetobacter sp. SAAs474]
MDWNIALILGQDGITSGAIYALLALCILLVFTVTRILLIPLGEFTVFGALTLASIQMGTPSLIVWLVLAFYVVNTALDLYAFIRSGTYFNKKLSLLSGIYVIALIIAMYQLPLATMPMLLQILFTLAVITPLGPQIYRTFFQPLVAAKSLVLLIVSIAVHVVLVGIGLLIFGPDGAQTTPFSTETFELGSLIISSQTIIILLTFILMIILFWYFFEKTLYGKALHATAVNRIGAQLMGISPLFAGKITFAVAAFIGALSGILIAPMTTLYYDSGFIISLKGFVGAIIGGLISFPIAAIGSVVVGLIEAFSMFWASDYKEIIVFTLIIPFLLWKSLTSRQVEEDEE